MLGLFSGIVLSCQGIRTLIMLSHLPANCPYQIVTGVSSRSPDFRHQIPVTETHNVIVPLFMPKQFIGLCRNHCPTAAGIDNHLKFHITQSVFPVFLDNGQAPRTKSD
jgi:hypothetical protein